MSENVVGLKVRSVCTVALAVLLAPAVSAQPGYAQEVAPLVVLAANFGDGEGRVGAAPAVQQGVIAGRVLDAASGLSLAAAQVFIPSLEVGTVTSGTGAYRIEGVPAGTHTIRIARLGYQSMERDVIVVSGETVQADFQLSQQALALDQVIVTGTAGGTQRRAVGNVVERLDARALLENAPIADAQQMLSNRVPGLTTGLFSGEVGATGGSIRIRGSSSIGVGNDPIVFIDGIRMSSGLTGVGSGQSSRLNDINPEDIESIEVIKGPAAATIYGTEASSGVIQIITRRGASGAPTWNASMEAGANWFPNPRETIGTYYQRERDGNLLQGNPFDLYKERTGESMYSYGPIQRYGLSVSGGSDQFRYFGSLNRAEEEGYVSWNTNENTSGRLSLDLTVNEMVSLALTGSFFQSDARAAGTNIYRTIQSAQLATLDDPTRRGFGVELFPDDLRDGQEDRLGVDRNTWSLEVRVEPLSWLSTRLVGGRDWVREANEILTYRQANAPRGTFAAAGLGRKDINGIQTQVTTLDFSGTARFRTGDGGLMGFATSAGLQYYHNAAVTTFLRGDEFANRSLTTVGAASRTQASESFLENATVGAYLQQEFDWDQRMFLTAAVRADDNSAFGANFNAAVYPKVSATWMVHEEGFWTDRVGLDWFEQLRLRMALGSAGQQPDIFASSTLYLTRPGPGNVATVAPQSLGNPDLGPEKGTELEVGFDAELLDGRVALEFTRYWRRTVDAIAPTIPTLSLGFPGTRFENIGEVSNWGSELSLNLQVLRGERLGWNLTFAGATMNNRLESLQGQIDMLLVNGQSGQFHVPGYPLAGAWGTKVLSAEFQSGDQGEVNRATAMCDGGTLPRVGEQAGPAGGEPVLCSGAPLVYFGRSGEPTWSLAVTSSMDFLENWRLTAHIDARGGNRRSSQAEAARMTTWGNVPGAVFQNDPIFMMQRSVFRGQAAAYDAGFARFREVSLQYTVPSRLTQRAGVTRASINFGLRNLGLIWQEQKWYNLGEVKVVDPEVRASGGASQAFDGHNHTQAPPMAQGLLRVRVTF